MKNKTEPSCTGRISLPQNNSSTQKSVESSYTLAQRTNQRTVPASLIDRPIGRPTYGGRWTDRREVVVHALRSICPPLHHKKRELTRQKRSRLLYLAVILHFGDGRGRAIAHDTMTNRLFIPCSCCTSNTSRFRQEMLTRTYRKGERPPAGYVA